VHGLVNGAASVILLLAAIFQYDGYRDGEVTSAGLVLTLVGFGVLAVGGWLGGSIVFVHGMRVESLLDLPARDAASPSGVEKP
jgi:uncharacterized membrane protein